MDEAREAAPALSKDRAEALRLSPVPSHTAARLDRFAALLFEWQPRMNLVARSTLPHLWTRHIADSSQLLRFAPEARTWVDLGSGAGFPGLVIACALAENAGAVVHLVESTAKKCSFLREAAETLDLPAVIHNQRIEEFTSDFNAPVDVVTARALAPLDRLLALAAPLLKTGTTGIFPKGQDVEAELTAASKYWNIDCVLEPSVTAPASRIVVVRKLTARSAKPLRG
jgi:16S rRNA (guanine527-N7)-methyltransferase